MWRLNLGFNEHLGGEDYKEEIDAKNLIRFLDLLAV
jgi:hypothetical protein